MVCNAPLAEAPSPRPLSPEKTGARGALSKPLFAGWQQRRQPLGTSNSDRCISIFFGHSPPRQPPWAAWGRTKMRPAASAKKPRELRRLVAYVTAHPKKYPRTQDSSTAIQFAFKPPQDRLFQMVNSQVLRMAIGSVYVGSKTYHRNPL